MAIDVGSKRTGIALANTLARIASPFMTLNVSGDLPAQIAKLAAEQQVSALVVGLPRSLNGADTKQTEYVKTIVQEIKQHTGLPVYTMDEAVTSAQAETELKARRKPYRKEDIDMLAAVYILEDFLREHPEVQHV